MKLDFDCVREVLLVLERIAKTEDRWIIISKIGL